LFLKLTKKESKTNKLKWMKYNFKVFSHITTVQIKRMGSIDVIIGPPSTAGHTTTIYLDPFSFSYNI